MKIQVKRGLKAELKLLDQAEFGFCTDTKELFIGDGKSNIPLGITGANGIDGVGIEYTWNGTQLGIKREDETNYTYVELKGQKGDQGLQGIQGVPGAKGDKGDIGAQGIPGKNIEFVWNGTQLGVRQQGQTTYTYTNLQGIQGPKGDIGATGLQGLKGDKGDTGLQGPIGLTGAKGADGLTTSVKLGSTQYNHSNGVISLPAYPTSLPANGGDSDTVDGKHASDFVKRIDLTGQVQKASYRKSVIALCEVTNANTSLNSYSIGEITFHRTNGLEAPVSLQFGIEKRYNSTKVNYYGLIKSSSNFANKIRPCTFIYNGVKYGGIEFYFTDAELAWVEFHGSSNFNIFGLDYYNTQNSSIINSEVNDSLNFNDDVILCNELIFNGSKVWHEGNFNPDSIPTKLSQLQNDIGAGGGTNIVCSSIEPNIKPGEWWYKE